MKSIKRKRSGIKGNKLIICALAVFVLAISLLNADILDAQIPPKQFSPVEVFQIEWGNDNGQVGLLKVPGRNYGPQSFAVDEGNGKIYILDSTNQRILIYDLSGTLLSFIPISERANDLCLGDKRNVYVLYKTKMKVVKYDLNGAVIATYPLIDTKSPVVGIHFTSEQGLFFETADETSYPLIEKGVKVSLEAQNQKKILGLSRNNDYFFLERKTPSQGIIRVLDFAGKLKMEIPVPKREGNIETLIFIGMDNEKNIYIVVEESTKSFEVRRYLRKYDPRGIFLAEALIPYSNYVYTFRDLRVTETGKVYQVLPLKEHVKVLIWTLDIAKPALLRKPFDRLFSYTSPRSEDFLPGDPIDIDIEQLEVEKQFFFLYAASISQNEIINRAENYRSHDFYVSDSNISTSGVNCETGGVYIGGKIVKTPVCSPGSYTGELSGVLYKWGGFTGLTGVTSYTDVGYFYDEGLAAGKYAGDKCTASDPDCSGIYYGSSNAVGVDCSGFVSQTWGLSAKESTSTLPNISCQLPSKEYLLEGDILDFPRSHVMLFAQRESDGRFTVYESAGGAWKVTTNSYTSSDLSAYSPYRYKNLSGVFQVGDRIQTIVNLKVRTCASTDSTICPVIATETTGAEGTIVSGPQTGDAYTWWEISYDDGVTGWSVQCYLLKIGTADTTSITITTYPSGRQITVDGISYTAPKTFDWTPGSQYTISTPSPQFSADGRTRYVFSSWSNGGAQTHTITVPSSNTTYLATFTTQYLLDTTVNPTGSGTISLNPDVSWYNANQEVQLTVNANAGYTFSSWSGDCTGQGNPCLLTMTGTKNATANFIASCADNDGDGYSPDGGTCGLVDCDDNNAAINPGAIETCDNLDNDCDGTVDGITSGTTCGVGECTGNTGIETCTAGVWGGNTCDPFAGATAEVCDNLDNDCDGSVDDGITPTPSTCGVGECASTGQIECIGGTEVDSCTPGTPQTEGPFGDPTCSDGLDNDCDGATDVLDSNCQDTCTPTASDDVTCDGVDDDCDGTADDDYVTTPTTCGEGVCESTGQLECQSGNEVDTCTPGTPTEVQEVSCTDGLDNDCDTFTDAADSDCSSTASIIYVEPSGICGGYSPCYSLIQDGIDAAGDGVTISVAQGTYYENIIVNGTQEFTLHGGWNSAFTSRTGDPSLTIIDGDVTGDGIGDDSVVTIVAVSGIDIIVSIEGFTVQNGNTNYGGGFYIASYSSGTVALTLNSNIISNNTLTAEGGGVGAFSRNSGSITSVTLTNNIITGNNVDINGGGLYALSEDSGNTILTLTNNTIADNAAIGDGGGLRAYSSSAGVTDITLKNNIIWSNTATNGGDISIRQPGGTTTIDSSYNDIGAIFNDPEYPGTYNDLGGNINTDPFFANPASENFHLTSGSPCIDAGTNTDAPLDDFEGDTRPFDGDGDSTAVTDIGADEVTGQDEPDITVTDSVSPNNDLQVPFGDVTEGSLSDKTITVNNDGTGALELYGVAQANPLTDPFSILNDNCSWQTLAPSENCTLTVRFLPNTEGIFNDGFDIPSDDPDENPVTVSVSGTGLSSVTNNPPSDFGLVYPSNGQTGLGTTVPFKWNPSSDPDGDPVTYDLYYCENQDFSGCSSEAVVFLENSRGTYYAGAGYGAGILIFGMVIAGGIRGRRKIALLIAMIMITGMILVSCGGGGSGGSNNDGDGGTSDEVSYTASGLNQDTTYYWKVVAKDDNGGETGSNSYRFTTAP